MYLHFYDLYSSWLLLSHSLYPKHKFTVRVDDKQFGKFELSKVLPRFLSSCYIPGTMKDHKAYKYYHFIKSTKIMICLLTFGCVHGLWGILYSKFWFQPQNPFEASIISSSKPNTKR